VPAPLKAITAGLSKLTPKLPVFKISDDAVSRDPQVVLDYQRDPLNHPGKLPARTLGEIMRAMDTIPRDAVALRVPLLLLHGGADRLCPPEGSRMVHANAGSADKTLKVYDGLYHEIFNEPEQDVVLDDLVAWLAERAAPARPRAEALAP
jgi:acylglycerol lipase